MLGRAVSWNPIGCTPPGPERAWRGRLGDKMASWNGHFLPCTWRGFPGRQVGAPKAAAQVRRPPSVCVSEGVWRRARLRPSATTAPAASNAIQPRDKRAPAYQRPAQAPESFSSRTVPTSVRDRARLSLRPLPPRPRLAQRDRGARHSDRARLRQPAGRARACPSPGRRPAKVSGRGAPLARPLLRGGPGRRVRGGTGRARLPGGPGGWAAEACGGCAGGARSPAWA